MLKYLLIALILVHATIQVEIVPEQSDVESGGHIEAKKYFKNKEWKGHHKKYQGEDERKEQHEGHGKRHHGDESGKYGKVHTDGDKKHFEEKHKKYYREAEHVKQAALVSAPEPMQLETSKPSKPMDLTHDIDVNDAPRPKNPQSEVLVTPKRDFYQEMKKIDMSSPPDPNNTVMMARYIVHNVDWAALATVTTRLGAKHSPFANVLSMSDGPSEQGSGVPFFYITPKDLSTQDLMKENRASVTATLAQTDYCRSQTLDPEDPRCARVILSGKVKRVKPGTPEEAFATKALFSRHPSMETWPKDHDFYIAKLKIAQIILLDQFGGPKYVDVEQYLHPEPQK